MFSILRRKKHDPMACHPSRFLIESEVPAQVPENPPHAIKKIARMVSRSYSFYQTEDLSSDIPNAGRAQAAPKSSIKNSPFTFHRRRKRPTVSSFGWITLIAVIFFSALLILETPATLWHQFRLLAGHSSAPDYANRLAKLEDMILAPQTESRSFPHFAGPHEFASHSNGGDVLTILTTTSSSSGSWLPGLPWSRNSPMAALDDAPGSFWLINGHSGQLGIRLSEVARLSHVTVDHVLEIPPTTIETAPRKMILWGVVDGEDNLAKYHSLRNKATGILSVLLATRPPPPIHHHLLFLPLVAFDYSIHVMDHDQTFPLLPPVVNSEMDFGVVVLEIVDNWGGSTTCLHRVRVHGDRIGDVMVY